MKVETPDPNYLGAFAHTYDYKNMMFAVEEGSYSQSKQNSLSTC